MFLDGENHAYFLKNPNVYIEEGAEEQAILQKKRIYCIAVSMEEK